MAFFRNTKSLCVETNFVELKFKNGTYNVVINRNNIDNENYSSQQKILLILLKIFIDTPPWEQF